MGARRIAGPPRLLVLLAGAAGLIAGPAKPDAAPAPAPGPALSQGAGPAQSPAAGPREAAAPGPLAGVLRFYRSHLSDLRYGHCQFTPSCSEYAERAMGRYGLIKGSALAADRLMRCNGSAHRFYARAPDGRLMDGLKGDDPGRSRPRVPGWLLPPVGPGLPEFPEGSAAASGPEDVLGTRDPERPSRAAVLDVVSFARDLAAQDDCYRAGTEYLRAAHMVGTAGWRGWARLQIGACYFGGDDWPRAEREFLETVESPATGEQRDLAVYFAAAARFNAGRYDACRRLLVATWDESGAGAGSGTRALTPVLAGLCDLTEGNWERARSSFEEGRRRGEAGDRVQRLDLLIARAGSGEALPRRSETLATTMSVVVPGSGQVYAGRGQDGLRHLIFNGALIYSTVKLVQGGHYPAAYLVGTLELPFYLGNVLGARRSAASFNREQRLRFTARSIELSNTL